MKTPVLLRERDFMIVFFIFDIVFSCVPFAKEIVLLFATFKTWFRQVTKTNLELMQFYLIFGPKSQIRTYARMQASPSCLFDSNSNLI